jgi:hypothetical protein
MRALQAIDPVAGIDIRAVKGSVGDRLCLCGNLNDCKPSGFVLGASNAVQTLVPIDNYRAAMEAQREYDPYPY